MVATETPRDAPAPEPSRIFISYKRDAVPDKSLATFLYEALSSQGNSVFLDVEIPPGFDWQEVISAQIQTSDLFVVLLSKASTAHGYVVAETVMAKESETARGHPKIFPVRLAYDKNLPLRMAAAIGHLQHFEWRSPSDNDALLGTLLQAVGKPKGSDASASLLLRGDHFIVTANMWQTAAARESLSGTTIVPVSSGQETSLAVTRAQGPGLFKVKVAEDGGLEVAIWKSTNYRRVESQPGRFITMLEGDSHSWCFARYTPDQAVLLERRDGRKDPIVVTFERNFVQSVWLVSHQRGTDLESFLIVTKESSSK